MNTLRRFAALVGLLAAGPALAMPIPVATWDFNGTFAANEGGAPAISAINPTGASGFITDTVFGVSRTVYRYDGDPMPPSQQAGLSVNTTGLLNGDNAYSVDMVFMIEASQSTWKSLINVSNRTSDNAFYVEPGNKLQIYPTGNGIHNFTFGEYHRVTLTNRGDGTVTAYMDGAFEFDLTTNVMDFSTYAGANPDRLMHFFVDNVISGGQGEYSDGRVAQIRLYDIELSAGQVGEIGSAPEPASLALLALGLAALARRRATN